MRHSFCTLIKTLEQRKGYDSLLDTEDLFVGISVYLNLPQGFCIRISPSFSAF